MWVLYRTTTESALRQGVKYDVYTYRLVIAITGHLVNSAARSGPPEPAHLSLADINQCIPRVAPPLRTSATALQQRQPRPGSPEE
jgi:hypothetical protein